MNRGLSQHIRSDVSLVYLINTTLHLKQEISCCTPEKVQIDSVVDRPAPDLHRKGRATVTAGWCSAAGLASCDAVFQSVHLCKNQ